MRRASRPPDLTSLFDVMFIVVFVALIRAASAQQAAADATRPKPVAAPVLPVIPADVAQLQHRALANLDAEIAARAPLVIRISQAGVITALEDSAKRQVLDVPLLEHSPDPDVEMTYLGDRSSELRVCKIAALHLAVPDLSNYLVIVAPERALADLPHALYDGLHRDLDRCLGDQHGLATLVDPAVIPVKP